MNIHPTSYDSGVSQNTGAVLRYGDVSVNANVHTKFRWVLAIAVLAFILLCIPALAGPSKGRQAAEVGEYELAMHEWLPFAERGERISQYNVGVLYHYGLGVDSDMIVAERWYQQSADQGYPRAMMMMGDIYRLGLTGDVDYERAIDWYLRIGEGGMRYYYPSRFLVGVMYADQDSRIFNREYAIVYATGAADSGIVGAQSLLGKLLLQRTLEDVNQAVSWLVRASAGNDVTAQIGLFALYFQGKSVPRNITTALGYLFSGLGDWTFQYMYRVLGFADDSLPFETRIR